MTVGAVIVPDGVSEALADATGRPAVRRIVDAAWAGGALPIVVVACDPDGRIAAVLEGSPAALVDPGRASEVRTYRLGAEAAGEAVQETTAVLLWPGRMTWADPETVTSLIGSLNPQLSAILIIGWSVEMSILEAACNRARNMNS